MRVVLEVHGAGEDQGQSEHIKHQKLKKKQMKNSSSAESTGAPCSGSYNLLMMCNVLSLSNVMSYFPIGMGQSL